MKKFNESILALFTILLTTATTNAWEWPWKTQARTWKQYGEQKLAQYRARLRSLLVHVLDTTDPVILESQQFRQDIIAHDIRNYWILSEKKEADMAGDEVRRKNFLVTTLLYRYDRYKNMKDLYGIDIKTLQLLEDWHYKYSNNRPDIHQKQKQ